MTKEEALEYRQNLPYDALGSYDWLVSDMEQDSNHIAERQDDTVEKIE